MQNHLQEEDPRKQEASTGVGAEPVHSKEGVPTPSSPPQEPPSGDNAQKRRNPAIRTMESDVQELMRRKDFTFTDAAAQAVKKRAREDAWGPARSPRAQRLLAVFGTAGAIVLVGALGIAAWFSFAPSPPAQTPPEKNTEKPPSFFRPNFSETLSVQPNERAQFLRAVESLAQKAEIPGAITQLAVVREEGLHKKPVALGEIWELFRVAFPETLAAPLDQIPMIFLFHGADGGRIGFVFTSENPDRTFSRFFSRERSLAFDFEQLFLGEPAEQTLAPFEDFTYRNVDWRFQSVSRERDQGIGYGTFPGRGLFIITTSRAAMEGIIDRLFERQ